MTAVRNPTYLLAPNWTFQPGGPIALGNIISDPFRPHRWLSKLGPDEDVPKTECSNEANWHMETENVRSDNISLWTKIFNLAQVDTGARRCKANNVAFDMSHLETVYFVDEPTVDDMAIRARHPRVSAVLNSGSPFRRGTIYMVTGLKIAHDFRLTQTSSIDRGGHAGAEQEVMPAMGLGVSVGGEVQVGGEARHERGFEATNDIIFAYQLLRIRVKGKMGNEVFEVEEFQDKAAFLNDDDDIEEEMDNLVLETDAVSLEDLAATKQGLIVDTDGDPVDWLFSSGQL